MTWTLGDVLKLVWDSIKTPQEGASAILNFAPNRVTIWYMLALVVILSVLLAQGTNLLFGGDVAGPFTMSPISLGIIQGVLLIVMIYATYWIGRAFGGSGSLEETMLLVTWLQFILVCVQVAQTLAMVVMPPFAGLIGVAALFIFFWLLVNFIAVLHGFSSLGLVFAGIILSFIGIGFGLALILTLIGITPGIANV
jgi:hypothetical protein